MGYPNQPGQPWQQPQQGYAPPQQQGYAPQAPQGYAPQAPAAGSGYNFGDLWTGADKTAGNLLAEGNYDAVVESSEFGQTQGGDKGAWTIKFRITTGPHANFVLTMTMSISPVKRDGTPNPAGMGIMFRQLHAMGVPVPPPIGAPGERPFWELGWTEHNVAQQMTGKPVVIRVIQNDWDGGTNNKVKDIKPAKPGAPTQVQQAQAPQQAPAPYGQPMQPTQYQQPQPFQAPQPQGQQWVNPAGQPVQGPPQAPAGPPPVPGVPQYAQPMQPGQPGAGQFTPQGMAQPGQPPAQPPWAQQAPQNGAQAPQPPQQPPAQPQPGQAPPAPPWAQQ